MTTRNNVKALQGFTTDELKHEIKRRKTAEHARKFLPNAEAALIRAQEKIDRYRQALKEEDDRNARRK